jgi:hypothetical protein
MNKQQKANEPENGVSCTGDTMKNKKTETSRELRSGKRKHAGSNRVGKFARSSLEAQEVGARDVGVGKRVVVLWRPFV